MLGRTVGAFAKRSGRRILFAASGGLSHDPPVPRIRTASGEARARLLGEAPASQVQQREREARVLAVAASALKGEGPVRPLNPEWDNRVLDLLTSASWDQLDAFSTDEVDRIAGGSANEVLAWVAAVAAMAECGSFEVVQRHYRPAPGWIAGVAHLAAVPSA